MKRKRKGKTKLRVFIILCILLLSSVYRGHDGYLLLFSFFFIRFFFLSVLFLPSGSWRIIPHVKLLFSFSFSAVN